MASFEVVRHSRLSADAAWVQLTDWPRHGEFIPFTEVRVTSKGAEGAGTVFVARTSIGPLGFDDPMEVTYWQPPSAQQGGICRIVKLGRVVTGWAVLTVTPDESGSSPRQGNDGGSAKRKGGASIRWVEEAQFRAAGPLLNWPNSLAGKYVFGRLVNGLLASEPAQD